jgi:phytoene synthase
MEEYTLTSLELSRLLTTHYSSSFSLGIRRLAPQLRPHIYAIYGFVRLADEIVDSFNGINQEVFLNNFVTDTTAALNNKFSLNPILHSFQYTVNTFDIDQALLDAFIASMRADLDKKSYATPKEYEQYIYGSADVVGLMCLQVFCEGNQGLFNDLEDSAKRLGSAFQKVNFLRDMGSDYTALGRVYFPGVDMEHFTNATKQKLVDDAEKDLTAALRGILKLPNSSRSGVYLAYRYYRLLLQKIQRTSSAQLLKQRVRIPDWQKALMYGAAFLRSR